MLSNFSDFYREKAKGLLSNSFYNNNNKPNVEKQIFKHLTHKGDNVNDEERHMGKRNAEEILQEIYRKNNECRKKWRKKLQVLHKQMSPKQLELIRYLTHNIIEDNKLLDFIITRLRKYRRELEDFQSNNEEEDEEDLDSNDKL
jgi:membrane-associated HD superfamily phosphohydrolase